MLGKGVEFHNALYLVATESEVKPVWLYHITTVTIFDVRFDMMNSEDRLRRRRKFYRIRRA